MRTLALLSLTLAACVMVGCGGNPVPQIQAVAPRADATNVRVMLGATNFDESWEKENVRLRCQQIWLDDNDVPTEKELVLEKSFNGRQGDKRAVLKMKDSAGESTRWLLLQFEVVSGENPTQETISAATTIEWKVPSGLTNQDILFVGVLSRKNRNSYAIDVLYAMNPATGEMEQVLPNSSSR